MVSELALDVDFTSPRGRPGKRENPIRAGGMSARLLQGRVTRKPTTSPEAGERRQVVVNECAMKRHKGRVLLFWLVPTRVAGRNLTAGTPLREWVHANSKHPPSAACQSLPMPRMCLACVVPCSGIGSVRILWVLWSGVGGQIHVLSQWWSHA